MNGGRNMFNSKYSNVLTGLLIVVIIIIIGLLGFLGYDMYRKYYIDKDADDFLSEYENQIKQPDNNNTVVDNNGNDNDNTNVQNPIDNLQNTVNNNGNSGSNTNTTKPKYKGFDVLGIIEIPKTGIKYPILDPGTRIKKAIEISVAMQYGPGPNEIGNTVIIGHNYRNGAFFGKNKQLANGDVIYITDNSGNRIQYTIYNIYKTSPEDSDYMVRNTNGAREISLSTCTDDSKQRLVIWAKE